ncbi:hypothetical protein [Scandinavium manionii]|uniref:hypothetical protein n=1 Tax=Scandinavium manionii TaxID=2926520 RepID=UPI00216590C9|nr:hypothetical protein [Scandinavium manionii]MCS2167372.1 hypothetical protein [Scandinavium manionii]
MNENSDGVIKTNDSLPRITKYRVEQEIAIKLNDIPVNSTQVKTDYTITHSENEPLLYFVHVDDYISKISPDAHQPLLDVVKEIDRLKSNVAVWIHPSTGKPVSIMNHQHIIIEWQEYKKEFLKKNEFIRAEEVKQHVINFISAFDEQILSHEQLVSNLDTQIFFTTFFDRFLVRTQNFERDVLMEFNSQLFEKVVTPLTVTQKIIQESPESVVVRKTGKPTGFIDVDEIERQYNQKYKPSLDYQFSIYSVEYDSQIEFNTLGKYLEYADVRMRERVESNLELDISCRIRRKV